MRTIIYIFLALSFGLLVFNLFHVDFEAPLEGNSFAAVVGVGASLCATILLVILQIALKIQKKVKNQSLATQKTHRNTYLFFHLLNTIKRRAVNHQVLNYMFRNLASSSGETSSSIPKYCQGFGRIGINYSNGICFTNR